MAAAGIPLYLRLRLPGRIRVSRYPGLLRPFVGYRNHQSPGLYGFKWTSDNPDLDIPNDTIVLRPNTTYKPPYKDTEYYLTATDEFGMSDTDTMFYESIQTKAEFNVEYLRQSDRGI